MREINGNSNNLEIAKVKSTSLKQDKGEQCEPNVCEEMQETSVKDFSNPSAEVLGRSQVSKADNIKSDLDFATAHPDAITKSDKLFEMALKSLEAEGDPQAYEKACTISTSEDAKALFAK